MAAKRRPSEDQARDQRPFGSFTLSWIAGLVEEVDRSKMTRGDVAEEAARIDGVV